MSSKISVKPTPKPKTTKKVVREVNITPVTEPVTEPAQTQIESQVQSQEHEVSTVKHGLELLLNQKNEHLIVLKQQIVDLKALLKAYDSELKASLKKKKVKKEPNPNRVPSGIAKPMPVTKEMYKFLLPYGIKTGELVSKTTAFKYITQYIKTHNLQNPECKTEFIPDKTLESLFTTKSIVLKNPEDQKSIIYTYTKIMLYIKKHFETESKAI